MIFYFVPEIFKFSYYANLVTDDVIGCASTVMWHKIKNISANNEALLLKLSRDVAPYKIYQMVHILMLLWQHARFQSPASLKSNIIHSFVGACESLLKTFPNSNSIRNSRATGLSVERLLWATLVKQSQFKQSQLLFVAARSIKCS